MNDTALLETPLGGRHAALGGRLVDFAGWRMPIHYTTIVDEHVATRTAAGLFDVSHMGRLTVTGPEALDWLEGLLTRRVADLATGRARYTLVTGTRGPSGLEILDDAVVNRDTDAADGAARLTLVVNASNRARVVAWLESRLPAHGVRFVDDTFATAMLAVQGPLAVGLICGLCAPDDARRIAALRAYMATSATVAGAPAAVSRTGYTGEDGVELIVPAEAAGHVWDAIHAAGAPRGLRPCGLGARDTLRLEAGMPLYGHELGADSDPFALGLGLAVNLEDPQGRPRRFPGAEPLRALRDRPGGRIRVGLAFDSRRAARAGSVVARPGGQPVGVVTSGSLAPSLGHAIAMALVDREAATAGAPLEVHVRDTVQIGRIVELPFYRRAGSRS